MWWTVQGIIILLFLLSPSENPLSLWYIVIVALLLIFCANLRLKRHLYGTLSKVVLILYTVFYAVVAFMFIGVCSPKGWLAIIIVLGGIINICCCLKWN